MMKKLIVAALFFAVSSFAFAAEEVTIAAGAGYKKLVTEMADYCGAKEGIKINMAFGNLGQIVAQVKTSGLIPVVLGDKTFFVKSGIDVAEYIPVGKGKLVLAWKKGLDIKSVEDITTDKVQRLAIPNTKNAIYGIAGSEYLASSGLADKVKDKLLEVATVPQVNSYIATGEVDAGFSNLTDTLGVADKIGGFIEINSGYKEIPIVTGFLKGSESDPAVVKLKKCFSEPAIAEIAKKHGL